MQVLSAVYETKSQKEFVENLKKSNAVLKKLREGMDIETVQNLMEEQQVRWNVVFGSQPSLCDLCKFGLRNYQIWGTKLMKWWRKATDSILTRTP